ncbi:glycine--tRNA ligase [Spiroplasma turonicum]|uniref:Glycine--tRNA ligase n=1 Tax=Spiroplasma turonicum TaxID=216946 RepID=A0A0K1P5I6_9MOLU|nr:glycine--tRNA ligase [Spiroplasma turonicum]AKU79525.1 glycyl-tRNA synthetase [Spiroplasma turonicum]ALX70548.1 glycyl-tRNA synthetase [Spiroplasma turonicum]
MKIAFDKIINHLKTQGFVFQGSEIYGGLANSWDYGPLGSELKNKLKSCWWNYFVKRNKLNVGIDTSIILNPKVWIASGHLGNFNDPLIDCKSCKSRFRADKLVEELYVDINAGNLNYDELESFIKENKISCPKCKSFDFTNIRQFDLMFKTFQGPIEDDSAKVYLRPETAQGIFVQYKNTQRALRKKLPFGIGQIGKSFRNEITPGNFIFRTREFEQMELEFFFSPNDTNNWFDYWLKKVQDFILNELNIKKDNFIVREHDKEELSHYSNKTVDIEYEFPFGRGELWGIAHRSDYDLSQHQKFSGEDLSYLDQESGIKFIPHVIEPSVGVERLLLALLCDSYCEEKLPNGESRIILKLPKKLAPYQIAVLPLQKQQSELSVKLYEKLLLNFDATYDESGNIGKRYRRQDAIGTPYCLTVDFETEKDNCVTVRDRDSMEQKRVNINDLSNYLTNN